MKRQTVAMLVIGLLLIVGISVRVSSHLFAQSSTSTIPFIAHSDERFYKVGNDNEIARHLTVDYARRGDLSHAEPILEVAPDGSRNFVVSIVDTRQRQVITLEPFTKSKTTFSYGPQEFAAFTSTQDKENCPLVPESTEISRRDVDGIKFGHSVRYVQSLHEQPGVRVDEERWVLPELRCFPIKRIATRIDGARSEAEVESLTQGEPDPALFTVPVEYIERSPLAMETMYKQKFNGAGFYGDRAAKSLDASYWKHRRTGAAVTQ